MVLLGLLGAGLRAGIGQLCPPAVRPAEEKSWSSARQRIGRAAGKTTLLVASDTNLSIFCARNFDAFGANHFFCTMPKRFWTMPKPPAGLTNRGRKKQI